jgi:hypothetical protein
VPTLLTVQLSEFTLYDIEGSVISIASSSSTCSNYPGDEAPEDAVDGSTGSKFLCFNHPTDLVVTFVSTSSVGHCTHNPSLHILQQPRAIDFLILPSC